MKDLLKQNWFKLSIVLLALLFLWKSPYHNKVKPPANFFDRTLSINANRTFSLKNNLKCQIVDSTDSSQKGQEFILSNMFAPVLTQLNSTGAENIVGGYVIIQTRNNFENYFTKIDETEETITMHYETIFGGIATFVLYKTNGVFVDSFIGVMKGSPLGYMQFGTCE